MISVIIPSYKDPYLHKTIDELLLKSVEDIEIVVVLDGYEPKEPIRDHYRVKTVKLGKNQGMRNAINVGVSVSTGEFIMRVDEHQRFGYAYDKHLTDVFEDNWIVTPRRYFLDPVKWEVMDTPPIDQEKLVICPNHKKFAAVRWKGKGLFSPIEEKMGMQGSCWIMKRSWWDAVIKDLDSEGYGTHYQDSIEMVFKTWQAGGKLMLNTCTWHAHKHRDHKRTHNYPNKLARKSFDYALEKWQPYYEEVVKPKWGM